MHTHTLADRREDTHASIRAKAVPLIPVGYSHEMTVISGALLEKWNRHQACVQALIWAFESVPVGTHE